MKIAILRVASLGNGPCRDSGVSRCNRSPLKLGSNYRIHLTRRAVMAPAESRRSQDHRPGVPGPRRPRPAGDANVRGSSINADEFVTFSECPIRARHEGPTRGSMRWVRGSEARGRLIASPSPADLVYPEPASAHRDSLGRVRHPSSPFCSSLRGEIDAIFQTGGKG